MENLSQIRYEEYAEAEAKSAFERQIEGQTDAAFSYPPQYRDEEYLIGYCKGLQNREIDDEGKIIWRF